MLAEQAENIVEQTVIIEQVLPQNSRNDAGDDHGQVIDDAESPDAFERQIDQRRQKITADEHDRHAAERIETGVPHHFPELGVLGENVNIISEAHGIVVNPARIVEERPDQRLNHRIQGKDTEADDERQDEHPALPIPLPELFQPEQLVFLSRPGGGRGRFRFLIGRHC